MSPTDLPNRPRIWTLFVVPIAALALTVVLMIPVVIIGGGKMEGSGLIATLILQVVAFVLVTLAAAVASPLPVRQRLRLGGSTPGPSLVLAAAIGSASIGMTLALLSLPARTYFGETGIEKLFEAIMSAPLLLQVVALAAMTVGAAVSEELLFRGYIQSRLRRRVSPTWAIIITAGAFGLVHAHPIHSFVTFTTGLWYGWLAERTGSIRLSILAHFGNNAIALGLAFALPDAGDHFAWYQVAQIVAFGAGCSAIALYCYRYLQEQLEPAKAEPRWSDATFEAAPVTGEFRLD